MCLSAAEAIKLQCGREYRFTDGEEQHATVLATEEPEKLVGLPTNKLITERDFSKFDQLAKVAKSRNRKFTTKGIRHSMVLFKSDNVKVDRLTKKITKLLAHHEQKWTKEQKQKLKEQIQLKLAKTTVNVCYKSAKLGVDHLHQYQNCKIALRNIQTLSIEL